MRFTIVVVALAVLVCLVQAQPVFEEESKLQDAQDQSSSLQEDDQDETLDVEQPELADAIEELDRREQETDDVAPSEESHSRQKRRVCYCTTRRGRRIVCLCVRKRA